MLAKVFSSREWGGEALTAGGVVGLEVGEEVLFGVEGGVPLEVVVQLPEGGVVDHGHTRVHLPDVLGLLAELPEEERGLLVGVGDGEFNLQRGELSPVQQHVELHVRVEPFLTGCLLERLLALGGPGRQLLEEGALLPASPQKVHAVERGLVVAQLPPPARLQAAPHHQPVVALVDDRLVDLPFRLDPGSAHQQAVRQVEHRDEVQAVEQALREGVRHRAVLRLAPLLLQQERRPLRRLPLGVLRRRPSRHLARVK